MLARDRQDTIVRLVVQNGSMTTPELMEALDASESTIRRDLAQLDMQRRVVRVHGGATAPKDDPNLVLHDYTMEQKRNVNTPAKRAIATSAAALIGPDDFVYIDAGTSTMQLVEAITQTDATYFTNSIPHAQVLLSKGCKTYLPGGLIKPVSSALALHPGLLGHQRHQPQRRLHHAGDRGGKGQGGQHAQHHQPLRAGRFQQVRSGLAGDLRPVRLRHHHHGQPPAGREFQGRRQHRRGRRQVMIYTVTFNPALDYIIRLEDLQLGKINRVNYEQVLAGGKGINVSIVLSNMGHQSCALGFVAGFTGRQIEDSLAESGVAHDFIHVKEGMTRINVKVKAKEETEINGIGPNITEADVQALYAKLDTLVAGDVLVISGSVPKVLPADIYERIMARLDGRGIDIVVDAERDLLVNVLQYHPFLIKPNNHELGAIFGVELNRRDEVEPYARKLQEKGARNVLISMAGEGAVLVPEKGDVIMSEAPKGTLVNSVGAGDSMVAGFLTGWLESKGDAETAFKMGVCTGSASAFSPNLATRPEVEALLAAL